MARLELCYQTLLGAGVVRYMRTPEETRKALVNLMHRHIEANLYVEGAHDSAGNRAPRVGGVDHAPGTTTNGRHVEWGYWFDPAAFNQ